MGASTSWYKGVQVVGGGGGSTQTQGKKREKKSPVQTHTKMQPAHHVVCALLMCEQVVCCRVVRPVRMRL